MKKIIFIVLAMLTLYQLQADEKKVNSKISKVTIYQQNAKINRSVSTTVPAGTSTIILQGLETVIQPQSIQVKLSKDVKMLSANFRLNYLVDKVNSNEYKNLSDSLLLLTYQIQWTDEQIRVLEGEAKLITDNQKLGGTQQGVSTLELKNLSLWYSQRMMEIRKNVFDLNKKKDDLNKMKIRILNQINVMSAVKTTTTGEIAIEVTAATATTVELDVSYLVTNVSWTPIYDIRSEGIEKNVILVYKANVVQSTGIDWKNVKISISTGNPNQNNSRPILNPRYLYLYQPTAYYDYDSYPKVKAAATNKNSYAESQDMGRAEETAAPDYNYVTMQVIESQLNVEFAVDELYSIFSDGKPYLVTMTEFEVPAIYEYHSVPSLDNGAFLLAKLTDWGKYNLLPGNANIFFENNYIGQSYINPKITYDTLLLSFGRDEKIVIKREKVYKESSVTTNLTTKKHVVTYEITLRNTKSKAVNIEVLDQVPLSNMKDVTVEVNDLANAQYVESIGKLLWIVSLQPNETKKIKFSYTVKHPKDQIIEGI